MGFSRGKDRQKKTQSFPAAAPRQQNPLLFPRMFQSRHFFAFCAQNRRGEQLMWCKGNLWGFFLGFFIQNSSWKVLVSDLPTLWDGHRLLLQYFLMFQCTDLLKKCVRTFICRKKKKCSYNETTTRKHLWLVQQYLKFFYLSTWHSVYLLSFITKHFLLKLQNFCPDLLYFFFPWHGICAPLGKQQFSPLHWNSPLLELCGEILSAGAVELSQSVWASAFRRGKKKGKVNLGTLLWLSSCRDFCCGTDLVQLLWQCWVVCLECLNRWKNWIYLVWWHPCDNILELCIKWAFFPPLFPLPFFLSPFFFLPFSTFPFPFPSQSWLLTGHKLLLCPPKLKSMAIPLGWN